MAETKQQHVKEFKTHELSEEEKKVLQKNFSGTNAIRVKYSEDKFIAPPAFAKWHSKYYNFESRPTDVWVVSFPKAGTTWTQEMTWCILNDLDFKRAKEVNMLARFPFFEWDGLLPLDPGDLKFDKDDPCAPGNTWKIVNQMKNPRTFKSHMLKDLLPKDIWTKKAKIIYVVRDPKDVVVSYYYHSIKLDGFQGDFNSYFDLFTKDLQFFSPIWKHYEDFWKLRNEDHILFIRYEELKEDLAKMCRKVAKFLGKELTDSDLAKLVDHLSFSNMSKNPSTNNESILNLGEQTGIKFMRKGKVGDWKDHFSKEQIEIFKKWTQENTKKMDFPFYGDF